jgi:hypothetical protein
MIKSKRRKENGREEAGFEKSFYGASPTESFSIISNKN